MTSSDYPELLWICRDYKFEIKSDEDAANALNSFLKEHEKDSQIIKNTKDAVKKSFNQINGFYLPLPDLQHQSAASSRKILLSIDAYKWDELNGEFHDGVNKLCKKIHEDVDIKMVNEMKLNGFMFADYVRKIVECLNKDETIYVVDMLDVIAKMNASRKLDNIKKKYSDALAHQFKKFPMPWTHMNSAEMKIRNACIEKFKASVGEDFLNELQEEFEKYIHDKTANSGVFLEYLNKNRDAVKKFADDSLEEIENKYKNEMQVKFSDSDLPCDWNTFENTENPISIGLIMDLKRKLTGFTTNGDEIVVDISLLVRKFKEMREIRDENHVRIGGVCYIYSKKNSDLLAEKFDKYLAEHWSQLRKKCDSTGSMTLHQYDDAVMKLKKDFILLSPNTPEKQKYWKKFCDAYYEESRNLLKYHIVMAEKNRLAEERTRREKEELHKKMLVLQEMEQRMREQQAQMLSSLASSVQSNTVSYSSPSYYSSSGKKLKFFRT